MSAEPRPETTAGTPKDIAEVAELGPFHAALRSYAFDDAGALRDLAGLDTRATPGFEGKKKHGQRRLAEDSARLSELQELLFANAVGAGLRTSVLLVIQGVDTSGKGGVMRHVIGAMDPQGVHQVGFKKPTAEELQHDFLWRIRKHTPRHGEVAVFDRSHYEDVLVHRVEELIPPSRLQRRYGSIRQFEKDLAGNGTDVIKVLLHLGKDEQYHRLLARLDNPRKHWKFTSDDVDAREKWDAYREAYQIALQETDKPEAPWFVIPADRKWYARLAVQHLLLERLGAKNLKWPPANFDVDLERTRLEATR